MIFMIATTAWMFIKMTWIVIQDGRNCHPGGLVDCQDILKGQDEQNEYQDSQNVEKDGQNNKYSLYSFEHYHQESH